LEPRNVQHLRQAERAKHQIRIDWHRFDLNIGNIGRQGYRHPPAVSMNLPHIDMPKKGMKHWPWRRKENYNRVKNHTRKQDEKTKVKKKKKPNATIMIYSE